DARGEPVHDRVPSPAHRGRGPVGGIRVPVRRVHRPSAAEVGPSAGPILHAAVKKRKVPKVITGLGITTVVAGGSCGSATSTITAPSGIGWALTSVWS